MNFFLESEDTQLIKTYISEKLDLDLLAAVVEDSLPIEYIKLNSWFELKEEVTSAHQLFFENVSQNYLIDIQDLALSDKAAQLIETLGSGNNLFFYSSSQPNLNASEKKLWQATKSLGYIILKNYDEKTKNSIALKYIKKIDLDISQTDLAIIVNQAKTYREIVDNLDFVDLADNKTEAIKSLITEDRQPIFTLGFDINKLGGQCLKWYNNVPEDEVQLALSLIYTKLNKQNTEMARGLIKKLILTDKNIKTNNKINSLTWWKLFLWESKNQSELSF